MPKIKTTPATAPPKVPLEILPVPTFAEHVTRWRDGCGSSQCEKARKVFARGTVPCEVLLAGEAPGASENALGRPFVGPAGKLLDHILLRAWDNQVTYCITNLVCCFPREDDGSKATEPNDEQVKSCAPRLQEMVRIADPRLIVCVGNLSRDWLDPGYKHHIRLDKPIPQVSITHPAALLRMTTVVQGLMIQRAVVQLRDAANQYL